MIAVIYYAYGAPKSIDDVETYFQHMLKGKPVSEPFLKQMVASFQKPGFPDFIRSSSTKIPKTLWL